MKSTQSIEINWPLKALFNYVADVDNHSCWRKRVVNVSWMDKVKNHSGSRMLETRQLMGQEVATVLEVTDFQLYRKQSVKVMKGTFRPSYTLEFEPNGESTVMTLTVSCPVTGNGQRGDVMKRMGDAGYKELLRLKEILERDNIS